MDVLDVNPAVTKPIKNGGIPPWHLLAFVDPECQWLKAWVHSHHGRSAFISLLNCRKEIVGSSSPLPKFLRSSVDNIKVLISAIRGAAADSPTRATPIGGGNRPA